MDQKKKIKIAIIILAVLLICSLLALGGTLLHNKLTAETVATVTVPDNLITPDDETTVSVSDSSFAAEKKESPGNGISATEKNTISETKNVETTVGNSEATQSAISASKQAATIELYDKQPEENTPFAVENMFPGDSNTKYYRVQVSYKDKVTVHYKATVRPGYEKLSEVMMVRIKLLSTGETLYNGLMRDMPESITYELTSAESTTDELYYEITAYLDTSVGNEYQNKDLIADFSWWAQETANLEPTPRTGSGLNIMPWIFISAVSGGVMIFLLLARKRREEEETNV